MSQTSLNTQKLTTESSAPHWPSQDYRLVTVCACVASLASFCWFFWHHELLLYGDAVAHINIARRVFDSRTPGAVQLGSVWLPLPHLLSIPFIVNDWMWRSGVGGSIASMIAYVLAVVGVFRLVRGRASRFAAYLAAALLGLNPNLLYMQSTAMTESIFLAAVIWAVVYFDEFIRGSRGADSEAGKLPHPSKGSLSGAPSNFSFGIAPLLPASKALERCGMVLAAAMLTRYDGWMLALVIGCAAVAIVLRGSMGNQGGSRTFWKKRQFPQGLKPAPLPALDSAPPTPLRVQVEPLQRNICATSTDQTGSAGASIGGVKRSLAGFLLLCALTPTLWLAHNYAINYRPLDWWNGPYSAQAIEERTGHGFPYPGRHNLGLAAKQFMKAARLNFSSGLVVQRTPPSFAEMLSEWQTWMLALAAVGTLIAVLSRARRRAAWLLLWLPLPFYAYSIAYGSVPVFVPVWWPFSYYNVRYGLELLPAFAVFAAVAVASIGERLPAGSGRQVAVGALILLLAANYWKVAEATPICLREARTNSVSRLRLESQLAAVLAALPPHSTLLMYTGEYVGALQLADVHLRRAVNETGGIIWNAGLSCPAEAADYVIAVDGNLVAQAVAGNPRWLQKIAGFSTSGKPDVAVYRSTFPGR
jgi:hypothetical protein